MPIAVRELPQAQLEGELRSAGSALAPAVTRGLAAELPIVKSGALGAAYLLDHLERHALDTHVSALRAHPGTKGKFGYGPTLASFNFDRTSTSYSAFIKLLKQIDVADEVVAIQGVAAREVYRDFEIDNGLTEAPAGGEYRFWLGTRAEVATHCDPTPNIAYVGLGSRKFTLFAPEEVGNLYMGPFNPTPSGTPISLADPLAPDFDRFPRFRAALDRAQSAVLEPGDAIFIPAGWYHHVEARAPLNLLINYWWHSRPPGPSPWDALMHGFMALRGLPPAERRAWQAMFSYYIFEADGDPAAHIPAEHQGILSPPTAGRLAAMRDAIVRALTGR